ncbi:MAG: L,D-transpeptidase family protein [Syntrophorhabdaceae bacterium]
MLSNKGSTILDIRPFMDTTRLTQIHRKIRSYLLDPASLFLIESVEEQKLFVCKADGIVRTYPASTSRFGMGARESSLKTPPGIHRVLEKIGEGAPPGRVFRDRLDMGYNANETPEEDNLILTRILRLEGLEKGINLGPGIDTYDRCVYIHGTNREDLVGTPLSHGCICLRNSDIAELFDIIPEWTILYIDPPAVIVEGIPCRNIHFAGIFGTGMSALAQYLRFSGLSVSGSDRLLTSVDTAVMRGMLEELGCTIVSQDGSGVTDETNAVCVSTAIEETNPDIAAARRHGVPIIHRSDLLAALIAEKKTVAVAGTSGKSTVTAMIFEFLTACGKSPSLISGAPLIRLEKQGLIGNAFHGGSDILVVEADESDGSLVKYRPEISVILNISKDHKTIDEITGLFEALIARSALTISNFDDPILRTLPATLRFGKDTQASWSPDREEMFARSVLLVRDDIEYRLPVPGHHNLENLRAALCVCEYLGCDAAGLARCALDFAGVARRFTITETQDGITVVDDFAHNPAKIAAAVSAVRAMAPRIIAVYQPHGFGPTRFLRAEYISTFRIIFEPGDCLYLLPIYYAGGTAQKDITSGDIIAGLGAEHFIAEAIKDRDELLSRLEEAAKPGDCIIVMGARDPSLPALVGAVIDLFGGEKRK